jgi:methyl-accepting chemotaxis protein
MGFNNARISAKLIAAFAVILSVFTLVCVVVFLGLSSTLAAAQQNNVSYQNIQDIDAVLYNVVEQQNAARGFTATGDETFLETYEKHALAADKHLDDFLARTSQEAQRERGGRLKQALTQWRSGSDAIVSQARDPALREQAASSLSANRLTQVREVQGEMREAQLALVAKRWTDQQETIGRPS